MFQRHAPDADALVNPTKGLKDEEAGVLDEILKAGDQEEVVHENLKEQRAVITLYTNGIKPLTYGKRRGENRTGTKCSSRRRLQFLCQHIFRNVWCPQIMSEERRVCGFNLKHVI